MDALNFLKFWKPNTSTTAITTLPDLLVVSDNEVQEEVYEEEDSFFDIEITLPNVDRKETNKHLQDRTTMAKLLDLPQERHESNPPFPLSSSDPISKRKILPIEPSFKPQSPIALLKSAPKFRVFLFNKPKSSGVQKTEPNGVLMETQKLKRQDTEVMKLKQKIEQESQTPQVLTSNNSLRSKTEDSKSERFSKDAMQKYLNLIKPLYVMVSKRYSDKTKLSEELSMASPESSPSVASVSSPRKIKQSKQSNLQSGIKVVCKHLGKSKSASSIAPISRRDDSLLQQHDGIQSAILHCKRSFNSSRDCSLSRFSSDSSEKSIDSMRNSFEVGHGERF